MRKYQYWESLLLESLQENIEIIIQYLPDNGVLFDIGANVGLVSEYVLYHKPNIKCYLFEPVPQYAQYCREKFINKPNVIVEQYGLSNEIGTKNIRIDPNNLGYNKITSEGTPIFCTRLDYYCKQNNIDYIDFVKIDVEGHECEVVEGMEHFLSTKNRPTILMETGWDHSREFDTINDLCIKYHYNKRNLNKDVLLY